MKSIMNGKFDRCYICGAVGYTEKHHIFGASNRKSSEKYGLTVRLCYTHHRDSSDGVHFNPELMERLHREGQEVFERVHGSREDFMRIFGRNYLGGD